MGLSNQWNTALTVAAPQERIGEASFQGGRGPCVRSDRTAPDLDRRTLIPWYQSVIHMSWLATDLTAKAIPPAVWPPVGRH